MELKIGDVVRVKRDEYEKRNGTTDASYVYIENFGVIKSINSFSISVEWKIKQDNFWDCEGKCKKGYGWNVEHDTLELFYNHTTVNFILKLNKDE